jgi:hypothetical protein
VKPPKERLNGEDYEARGPEYEEAWDRLVVGCLYPPSLEVFQEGLKNASKATWWNGMTVERYAIGIVNNYKRIR